jgi:hypothetical protein
VVPPAAAPLVKCAPAAYAAPSKMRAAALAASPYTWIFRSRRFSLATSAQKRHISTELITAARLEACMSRAARGCAAPQVAATMPTRLNPWTVPSAIEAQPLVSQPSCNA